MLCQLIVITSQLIGHNDSTTIIIVQLLRVIQKKLSTAKRSGDFTANKSACATVRTSIRSQLCNHECRLVYSNNCRNFYPCICSLASQISETIKSFYLLVAQ